MIKAQLDEMEQWAQDNLEDLQSRKRNDGEEELTRGCFKARLRALNGVHEKRFYQRFRRGSSREAIEANPNFSRQVKNIDKMVMATGGTDTECSVTSGKDKEGQGAA